MPYIHLMSNPTKAPLNLLPPAVLVLEAEVLHQGNAQADRRPYDWRTAPRAMSLRYAAALRHLFAWFDGEDADPDDGLHHLAHARACLGILLDEILQGLAVDDRPQPGRTADLIAELQLRRTR